MSPDQHFAAAADLAVRRRLPAQPAVAVVGATGAVGVELIACLEDRGFPLSRLRLLASSRSAGRSVMFRDQTLAVETLGEDSFAGHKAECARLGLRVEVIVSHGLERDVDEPAHVPDARAALEHSAKK